MVLLGLAVRHGSTLVDDWFHRNSGSPARFLLIFTDPRVLALVVLATLGVALYRRQWRLAVVAGVCPLLAIGLARALKPLFDRQKDGGLAYPSGHTTVAVVVVGLAVLVAGVAWWAVLVAVAYCLLAMLGVGMTFHYFTDTVGGLLLGTAIVCVASLISGRVPHRT